jgi:hypothetical protein
MILESELRPGNYLLKDGHWVTIDGAAIHDITRVPGEAGRYERIPLNSAVLDRCGFREGSIRVSNDVGWAFKLEVVKGEMVLAVQEYALPLNCSHLHQLQNLYYALTGEELKVRL